MYVCMYVYTYTYMYVLSIIIHVHNNTYMVYSNNKYPREAASAASPADPDAWRMRRSAWRNLINIQYSVLYTTTTTTTTTNKYNNNTHQYINI